MIYRYFPFVTLKWLHMDPLATEVTSVVGMCENESVFENYFIQPGDK